MEERTVDTIMESLNQIVSEKKSLSPHYWVEAAKFLNVLIGDEHGKLWKLKQKIAQQRAVFIRECKTVAEAKVMIEGTDDYRESKILEAKIDQVNEMIRLAKLQARLTNDEIRNY